LNIEKPPAGPPSRRAFVDLQIFNASGPSLHREFPHSSIFPVSFRLPREKTVTVSPELLRSRIAGSVTTEYESKRESSVAMNVSFRRRTTAVLMSALLLVLIACTVTGISGPNIVALGDTATYDITFDNTGSFSPAAGYIYFDVPLGWSVTSASYDATVNGVSYTNVPATQAGPADGPCGATAPPPPSGYQRLVFQSDTYPTTTVDDSGTLHVTFDIAGGAGNFVLNAFGGGGFSCNSASPQTLPVTVNGTLAAPRPAKSFAPSLMEVGTTSTLTIDLMNLNTASLSDIGFVDTYPNGLVNAATPNATSTCGGSIIAPAGGSSLQFSGGTLDVLSGCSITIDVTSAIPGSYDNTLGEGAITTGEETSPSEASNVATLDVVLAGQMPPTVDKFFIPEQIAVGETSSLTITLNNPNSIALTGVNAVDTYPAGLVNAAAPNAATTCAGGSVIAVAGGADVELTNATIPANGSCTVTVDVTSTTPDVYENTIEAGAVTSANGVPNDAPSNTAILGVEPSGPVLTKSFTPDAIPVGGTSRLTVTITTDADIPFPSFEDLYPAGLTNTATPNVSTTCVGDADLTADPNGTSLGFWIPLIEAGTTCSVSVDVTSSLAGTYENVIPAEDLRSDGGPTNRLPSNTATLAVLLDAPTVAKAFTPAAILAGGTSTLTITLTNPNADAITGVAFTDAYPAGLVHAAVPNVSSTCGSPTLTADAGGTELVVSDATIPANGSCTVSVDVTSLTAGLYANELPAGSVTSTNAFPNDAASNTATLEVTALPLAAPTVAKAFAPTSIVEDAVSTLTITLTNSNGEAITGVAFTDAYPAGLVNAAPTNAATTCGGTVTAAAGGNSLALSAATIPANGSCTVSVDVTAATAGTYDNLLPAGAVTSDNAPANATPSNTATLEVTAAPLAAPTVAKAFAPTSIVEDAVSTLTITLTNSNGEAITGVTFTDAYPAGLVNAATTNAATTCGGTVTAAAGGNSLALSAATIPANGSCTVSVDVTAATAGTYDNDLPAGAVTSDNAPANATPSNTATLEVTAAPLAAPTVAKAFAPTSIVMGESTRLTITLENANATDITGAAFTDPYPAGLVNADPSNAATTCGGTLLAPAGGTSLSLSGATIPAGGSCTVSVDITATAPGSYINEIVAGAITSDNAPANTIGAASEPLVVSAAAASVAAVPTLGEWGLMLLAAALGLVALRAIRV
jgi:uncharacterized repeat protein (TIGR01451 family)